MTPLETMEAVHRLLVRLVTYDAKEVTKEPLFEGYQDEERFHEALKRLARISPRLASEIHLVTRSAVRSRLVVTEDDIEDDDGGFSLTAEPEETTFAMPWRTPFIDQVLTEALELVSSTYLTFQSYEQDPRLYVRDIEKSRKDAIRYGYLLETL